MAKVIRKTIKKIKNRVLRLMLLAPKFNSKEILFYIKLNWPIWFRWYETLPFYNQDMLKIRMNTEEDFISDCMWQYAEFVVWKSENSKIINEINKMAEKKWKEERDIMLSNLNKNLSEQYGFNLKEDLKLDA